MIGRRNKIGISIYLFISCQAGQRFEKTFGVIKTQGDEEPKDDPEDSELKNGKPEGQSADDGAIPEDPKVYQDEEGRPDSTYIHNNNVQYQILKC